MMPIQMALFLVFLLATPLLAADPAENLTETDEAEYRQGGIAAPGYPAGMYGAGPAAYQQYAAGGGAGYMNVLRNLYRPPSLGLTDKVKHWVKSFMNRRQAVKPFYGAPGLQYQPDEFGAAKPMLVANGYKAISVPLRQLQKYYKTPYYGGEGQFQNPQQPASASSSVLSYSSPGGGNGGLYASETTNNGAGALFSGGNSGLFGAGSSGLFGQGNGNLFGSDASGALFANGGSHGAGLFSGSPGGMYSSGGASGYYPSANDEAASALFGAGGLTGAYAAAAGNSGSLYQHQSSGSPSAGGSAYSLDGGSSSFGSDGGSQSYFGNGGSSQYGADLYASGASPQASVYNPNEQQNRGYSGGSSGKKQQKYGASSSALYIPSSSDSMRISESHQMRSGSQEGQQAANSFSVDSSRGGSQETSYSVSFQPAQGKSYSAPYDNSGFQPVSFGSEEGFKGKSS